MNIICQKEHISSELCVNVVQQHSMRRRVVKFTHYDDLYEVGNYDEPI